MEKAFTEYQSLPEFPLWGNMKSDRNVVSFELEITARCNNNCRHCYINLPADDRFTRKKELSLAQIEKIADEALSLGAIWCLITGGEPLLREDFPDIYLSLKKKGLLVSVFTNAALLGSEHVKLFKKCPPRDVEVTVYGASKETYEKVTRRPGSFDAFTRGVNLLLKNNIKTRFKAMALRSNAHELPQVARFCRERTKDYFRFDPFLHFRLDRDRKRNEEIASERLSPEEIVALEQKDPGRSRALEKNCDKLIDPDFAHYNCDHLFHCGAGVGGFAVSYDGFFRVCSSLCHPDCIYDLKKGRLAEAWDKLVPKVRDMRSKNESFLRGCRKCELINLCMWCPARADLETGGMDALVRYFCDVAHARAKFLLHSRA